MEAEAIFPAPRATWAVQRLGRLLGQLQARRPPILLLRLVLVQLLALVLLKLAMQQLQLQAGAAPAAAAQWVVPVETVVDANTLNVQNA